MKCIKRIRPVLIGVSVFLCSCLTGCSLSFCGIGTPKEEFVFYCDTEPERTEQTEKTEKTEETEQKEQELPEEQQEADARVNINTAGVEELMTLKAVHRQLLPGGRSRGRLKSRKILCRFPA